MPAPQSYKNHTRLHPPFHFFILPILILNFAFSIYITIHEWPAHPHLHPWLIIVSFALLLMAPTFRMYCLKVQDRVIRMEERLRLAALLPPADLRHIDELSIKQLVALRFASDDELPALVHKALTNNLEPKAIKQSIVNWRSDNYRV